MIRSTLLRFSLFAALLALGLYVGAGFSLLSVARAQQQPAPASGGNLQERISQLEQRIVDLQSVVATLQSFVKQGGGAQAPASALPSSGAGAPGGGPSELSIRVLALETQIRALTGQMEQINSRLGGAAVSPGTGAPIPPIAAPAQPGADFGAPPAPRQQALPYGAAPAAPTQQAAPRPQARPPWQADPNAVAPSPIPTPPPQSGQLPTPRLGSPGGSAQLGGATQAGSGAQAAYDASYQNFLRNDLRAAEQGFRSFVATYPDDQLAGNAYYWLGRTHFANRQFEPAAKAFLAGYKKNKKSAIAPDSLLHLGKSLAAMGEKDAACSTLKAVGKQFPAAPGQLRQDVSAEMKRNGC
ncbi:MAG: tol-pal system protein YbgF [Hyphomicrobiaceae bacterium]|nr:tol-pal system protein YbgF [Hyphomicrobiaceae bacterium]